MHAVDNGGPIGRAGELLGLWFLGIFAANLVAGCEREKSNGTNNSSPQPHRRLHREQAISTPPPLCTIIEQKSIEEREGHAQDRQGPSPIQVRGERRGTPMTGRGRHQYR